MEFFEAFLETASEIFNVDFSEEVSYNNFIKLTIADSSGSMFMFLLARNNGSFIWKRQVINKTNDLSSLDHGDILKNMSRLIVSDNLIQKGVTYLDDAKEIFKCSRAVLDLDFDEKSDKILIEGSEYALQIKSDDIHKEFKWKSIPQSWSNV